MSGGASVLNRLREFSTPTMSNALECLGIDPSREFTSPTLRTFTPDVRAVGYATTASMQSLERASRDKTPVDQAVYWRYVSSQAAPKIAVVEDLDDEPLGAMWGEVNASIHMALGCAGVVTNGTVRDIDEMRRLGFFACASDLVVSHAFAHWVDFGQPVNIRSMRVAPGDLLHGDKHGVLRIPPDVDLAQLVRTAEEIEHLERRLCDYCQNPEFELDGLVDVASSTAEEWPGRRDVSQAI